MADSLRDLIRDTLHHLQDPLRAKQPLLASSEERSFFQQKKGEPRMINQPAPIVVKSQAPPPPQQEPSPMKKILQKAAPAVKIIEQVPDDTEAKRIAESWKEKVTDAEVVLLVCDTASETLDFLKGLAKGIDQHLAKTKILAGERLEREKRWDIFLNKNTFRLIIASEGMEKLPELMRFYKPESLGKFPLLTLSPASVYKALEHKALLWKTLCQMLKK
jgi:hypothetical protein